MSKNRREKTLYMANSEDTVIKLHKNGECQNKVDGFMVRQAIRISYEDICKNYDSQYNTILFSKHILHKEKYEHCKQQEKEYGGIKQCKVLLDYILHEASNDQVVGFFNVIKEKQHDLYELIESPLRTGGTIKVFIQEIKEQLQKAYCERKYHCVEALPGEEIILNLKNKRFLMPLEFKTEVRETIKESYYMRERKYYYVDRSKAYQNIEEILGSLLNPPLHENEDESRVVLVTAEAGCGKTVSIHRMVCQWVNQCNLHLVQYDLVISIPLRHVDTEESLTTIISDTKPKSRKHKGGLGYITNQFTIQALDDYLKDDSDKKVLCMLDGVDEVEIDEESDLFKLITGEKFPRVKLVITSRPEGKLMKTLRDFYPDYKVSITGTTKDGINAYLKEMMTKEGGPSQDEITDLIQKCEDQMVSFHLLTVPLYLTLVGVMFNDHWAQFANFTNFQVPTTMSCLFNSFFRILVTRWIQRDSCYSHIKQVKFGRNPYDQTSIPNDILYKLHCFANMSYFFLKNKIYNFTTSDLENYFIDINDIIASGFFCHSDSTFFYRHKLLQEFMSALYLIHPMCTETFKTPKEQDTFDNIMKDSDTFLGLENISTFVFGMSPLRAKDIINKLQGKLVLKINEELTYDRLCGIQVTTILKLCDECNDRCVTDAFISLLSKSHVCFAEHHIPVPDISLYKRFFHSITTDQAILLLLSWYNIHMYPIADGGWAVKNGDNTNTEIYDVKYDNSDGSLRIECFHLTLILLLEKFTLPQVHSLFVDDSWVNIPDMITIEKMLPNVTKLLVRRSFTLIFCDDYRVTLNLTGSSTNKLKSLQHINHPTLKYSPQSQQLLLQQSHLETLCVHAALIHDIGKIEQHSYWPKLHTLQLYFGELESEKASDGNDPKVCAINDLCHLLTGLPHLRVLGLTGAHPSVNTITTLLQCIQDHLPSLNKLHLRRMLGSQTLFMIFPVIRTMEKLTNLGLYYKLIDRKMECIIKGLSTVNNIKQLEVLYFERQSEKGNAQTTKNNMVHLMNTNYPDMSIDIGCTEGHDMYLQPDLPDPVE